MLCLEWRSSGGPWQRQEFETLRLSAAGVEPVLPVRGARGSVPSLARVETLEDALFELDADSGHFSVLAATPSVFVNGVASRRGQLVAGDEVRWGPLELRMTSVESPRGYEGALESIHADPRARAVWADELEAQGLPRSADYVRWSGRDRTDADVARLRGLELQVSTRFRSDVASVEIQRCQGEPRRAVDPGLPPCPKRWEALPRGRWNGVRDCSVCRSSVLFIGAAITLTGGNSCFAIDPAMPQDLALYVRPPMVIRGRPLLVDGRPALAPVAPPPVPAAATDWLAAAQAEHASVASFARTLCQLMSLGAPLELLRRTQQALADEIRHTELTLAQLARVDGRPYALGPLPEATAPLSVNVDDFIAEVRLGADAERASVDEALAHAKATADPTLRAFHQGIADDETRHVALAEDTARWLEQLRLNGRASSEPNLAP